jgi:hypothetical protein
MTSSLHGPYGLGYTRATMAVTIRLPTCKGALIVKSRLSSDCTLQLECMKLESLVIADQHAAVNTFPGLVHTARHTMEVGSTLSQSANRKGAADHGRVNDWGEVVTR